LHQEDDDGSQMSADSFLSHHFVDQSDVDGLKRVPEWNDYVQKSTHSQTSSQASSQSHSFPDSNGSAERSHYSGSQVKFIVSVEAEILP